MKAMLLLPPIFLYGFLPAGGLPAVALRGLPSSFLVIMTTVTRVVRLVRAAVSLAVLANFFDAHLLQDSIR